jgi:anhydro-N-acetylmuramic acid kinase
VLKYFLADPYFSLKPPKSTGRELFNKHWLKGKLREYGKPIEPKNLQATLSALTATSIANAVSDFCSTSEVYICGGGVHNKFLMENLRAFIPNPVIKTTQSLGIDPDWVESVTFAWMAKQTIENRQVDTTAFTGSAKPSILGGVYKGN